MVEKFDPSKEFERVDDQKPVFDPNQQYENLDDAELKKKDIGVNLSANDSELNRTNSQSPSQDYPDGIISAASGAIMNSAQRRGNAYGNVVESQNLEGSSDVPSKVVNLNTDTFSSGTTGAKMDMTGLTDDDIPIDESSPAPNPVYTDFQQYSAMTPSGHIGRAMQDGKWVEVKSIPNITRPTPEAKIPPTGPLSTPVKQLRPRIEEPPISRATSGVTQIFPSSVTGKKPAETKQKKNYASGSITQQSVKKPDIFRLYTEKDEGILPLPRTGNVQQKAKEYNKIVYETTKDYMDMGDVDLAKSNLSKEIEKDPNNEYFRDLDASLTYESALKKIRSCDPAGAAKDIEVAIAESPENTNLHKMAAYAYLNSGEIYTSAKHANSLISFSEDMLRRLPDYNSVESLDEKRAIRDKYAEYYDDISYMYKIKSDIEKKAGHPDASQMFAKKAEEYESKKNLLNTVFYNENSGLYTKGFSDYLKHSPWMMGISWPVKFIEGFQEGLISTSKAIAEEFNPVKTWETQEEIAPGVFQTVRHSKKKDEVDLGIFSIPMDEGDNVAAKIFRVVANSGMLATHFIPAFQEFTLGSKFLSTATGGALDKVEEFIFAPITSGERAIYGKDRIYEDDNTGKLYKVSGSMMYDSETGMAIASILDFVPIMFLMGMKRGSLNETKHETFSEDLRNKLISISEKAANGTLKESDRLTPAETAEYSRVMKANYNNTVLRDKLVEAAKQRERDRLDVDKSIIDSRSSDDHPSMANLKVATPGKIKETVSKIEQGASLNPTEIKTAGTFLEAEYSRLERMKDNPDRLLTTSEIETIQRDVYRNYEYVADQAKRNGVEPDMVWMSDAESISGIKDRTGISKQILAPGETGTEWKGDIKNDSQNRTGVSGTIGEGKEPVEAKPINEGGQAPAENGGIIQTPEGKSVQSINEILDTKTKDLDVDSFNEDALTADLVSKAKEDGLDISNPDDASLFHDFVKEVMHDETMADKTVGEAYTIALDEYKKFSDDIKAGRMEIDSNNFVNKEAQGKDATTPSATYNDAIEEKAETTSRSDKFFDSLLYDSINKSVPGVDKASILGGIDKVVWDGVVETIRTVYDTTADFIKAINAGLKHIQDTDWYKGLTSEEKLDVDIEYKQSMKGKAAGFDSEMKKTPVQKQIEMATGVKQVYDRAYNLLKSEYKMGERGRYIEKADANRLINEASRSGAREEASKYKNFTSKIQEMLKSKELAGSLTPAQSKSIVNAARKVTTDIQLAKFEQRVDKIFQNANYEESLNKAKKLRSKIKKAKNYSDAVQEFIRVNPEDVSNIDAYIDMATKVKSVAEGVKIKSSDGLRLVANENLAASNREILDYTTGAMKENKAAELDRYERAEMKNMERVDNAISEISDIENNAELKEDVIQEKIDAAIESAKITDADVKRVVSEKQAELKEVLDNNEKGYSDGTKEYEYTADEVDVIRRASELDSDYLPEMKDKLEYINSVNDAVANGNTHMLEKYAALAESAEVLSKYEKMFGGYDNVFEGSRWFRNSLGSFMAGLRSSALTAEHITGFEKAGSLFSLITREFDLYRHHAEAMKFVDEVSKKYDRFLKDQKKVSKENLRTSDSEIRKSLLSDLYEYRKNSEGFEDIDNQFYTRLRDRIVPDIERKMSSSDEQLRKNGEIKKDALMEFMKSAGYDKTFDQLSKELAAGDPTGIPGYEKFFKANISAPDMQAVKFFNDVYSGKYEEWKMLHGRQGRKSPIEYENYSGSKQRPIGVGPLNKPAFSTSSIKPTIKSFEKSTERKLASGHIIDDAFSTVQLKNLYDMDVKIKTLVDRQVLDFVARSNKFDKLFGEGDRGQRNKKLFFDGLKNRIATIEGTNEFKQTWVGSLMGMVINGVRNFAYKTMLLGVSNYIRQSTTSVSTAARATMEGQIAPLAAAVMNIGKAKWVFDKNTIGARGKTKAGFDVFSEKELESDLLNKLNSTKDVVKTLDKWHSETWEKPLVNTDVAMAKFSWLTNYFIDQQKRGRSMKDIMNDFHNGVEDKEAAAYAEHVTSKTQGPNSAVTSAEIYSDPKFQWFKMVVLPFSSYSLNLRMRMDEARQKIGRSVQSRSNADLGMAVKDFVAAAMDQAAFNAIKDYVIGPMIINGGAKLIMNMMGITPTEDKSEATLKKDLGGGTYSKNDYRAIGSIINDIAFSGTGALGEYAGNKLGNFLYKIAAESEKDYKGNESKPKDLFSSKKGSGWMDEVLELSEQIGGTYLATPLKRAINTGNEFIEMISGDTTVRDGGEDKTVEMTDELKKLNTLLFIIDVITMSTYGDRDLASIADKIRVEKKRMIQRDKYAMLSGIESGQSERVGRPSNVDRTDRVERGGSVERTSRVGRAE